MSLICLWAPVLFFFFSVIDVKRGVQTSNKTVLLNEPVKRKAEGLDRLDYLCEPRLDLDSLRERLIPTVYGKSIENIQFCALRSD